MGQHCIAERDLIHVYSALGVFDHTPVVVKRKKLNDLKDSAKRVGDKEIQLGVAIICLRISPKWWK